MPLLILDLDNTLLDRAGAFQAWAREFVRTVGAPESDVDWILGVDADGMTDRWDVADALKERYRLRTSAIDLVDALRDVEVHNSRFDPLVGCALNIASQLGWVPVVVTNGQTRLQEAKIRNSGLDAYVAGWVISEEAGVSKPNPRIFGIAADRARMHLRGAWIVGESPEADIGGASALGLPSVWLHRGRQWSDPRYTPTITAEGPIAALAAVIGTG